MMLNYHSIFHMHPTDMYRCTVYSSAAAGGRLLMRADINKDHCYAWLSLPLIYRRCKHEGRIFLFHILIVQFPTEVMESRFPLSSHLTPVDMSFISHHYHPYQTGSTIAAYSNDSCVHPSHVTCSKDFSPQSLSGEMLNLSN